MHQYFANQDEQINVNLNINLRSDFIYLKFYFFMSFKAKLPLTALFESVI